MFAWVSNFGKLEKQGILQMSTAANWFKNTQNLLKSNKKGLKNNQKYLKITQKNKKEREVPSNF